MKIACLVCLVITLAVCSAERKRSPLLYQPVKLLEPEAPAVNATLITDINNRGTTWKAGVNENFKGWTMSQAKKLLGWKPSPVRKLPKISYPAEMKANLPDNFNAATNWPTCTTIGHIYDQARCGSCWAFGCVEPVSDRFCIQSKVQTPILLSFEDLVCCGPDDGCEGGEAEDAWSYAQSEGLVTAACSPYTVPTCQPSQEPCLDFVDTPACVEKCNDSETWSQSKHYLSNTYGLDSVSDIMKEIMTNGPVEACFSVYNDFLQYKSGVYIYDGSSQFLGGHCIKMLGWGVENGTPYWLCNNQWTTYWGDKGTFKIRRGTDECGIEDDVVAGMIDSQRSPKH